MAVIWDAICFKWEYRFKTYLFYIYLVIIILCVKPSILTLLIVMSITCGLIHKCQLYMNCKWNLENIPNGIVRTSIINVILLKIKLCEKENWISILSYLAFIFVIIVVSNGATTIADIRPVVYLRHHCYGDLAVVISCYSIVILMAGAICIN